MRSCGVDRRKPRRKTSIKSSSAFVTMLLLQLRKLGLVSKNGGMVWVVCNELERSATFEFLSRGLKVINELVDQPNARRWANWLFFAPSPIAAHLRPSFVIWRTTSSGTATCICRRISCGTLILSMAIRSVAEIPCSGGATATFGGGWVFSSSALILSSNALFLSSSSLIRALSSASLMDYPQRFGSWRRGYWQRDHQSRRWCQLRHGNQTGGCCDPSLLCSS